MQRAFTLMVATGFAAAGYAAQAPARRAPASAPVSIDRYVNTFDQDKTRPTKAGYEYWFADRSLSEDKTIKLSAIGPRLANHPPHVHVEDEFFFILEGEAEFFLAGERRTVGPMTSLYAPSNVEHGIRNPGDKELKYLVIKRAPEPATPATPATPAPVR